MRHWAAVLPVTVCLCLVAATAARAAEKTILTAGGAVKGSFEIKRGSRKCFEFWEGGGSWSLSTCDAKGHTVVEMEGTYNADNAVIALQADGNLCIYKTAARSGNLLFQTNTPGNPKAALFVLDNGTLELRNPGDKTPLWSMQ